MPLSIPSPSRDISLTPFPLTESQFSPFGTVITNPSPSLLPSSKLTPSSLPQNAVLANQGSALKYQDVTHMRDLYSQAPSRKASTAVMNMFVCAPRKLEGEGVFKVEILERHPYTTQTFIPLGLSPFEAHEAQYLVIVAPSLPPSNKDEGFSVPEGRGSPGRGLPDLENVRAFIARGDTAVTYAAGTWHAPMVVLGRTKVDFVVVQFANGVGEEDCQEVVFGGEKREGRIEVRVRVRVDGERMGLKL
ncbi:hypothetical protein VTL71DRAFT_7780 [Oculimacula yallundae]|uniref:Ureidoglycolate hydrolase n=1 Tax=Oculimacula yallundae TaxID=86028 RepID=A0ABR4CVY4_9HELO